MQTIYREASKIWRSNDPVNEQEYRLGRPSRLHPRTIRDFDLREGQEHLEHIIVARIRDPKPQYIPSDTVAHDFVVTLLDLEAIGKKPHTLTSPPAFWSAEVEQLSANDIAARSSAVLRFSELAISNRGIILAIDGKKDGIYPPGMGYILSLQAAGKRRS